MQQPLVQGAQLMPAGGAPQFRIWAELLQTYDKHI